MSFLILECQLAMQKEHNLGIKMQDKPDYRIYSNGIIFSIFSVRRYIFLGIINSVRMHIKCRDIYVTLVVLCL